MCRLFSPRFTADALHERRMRTTRPRCLDARQDRRGESAPRCRAPRTRPPGVPPRTSPSDSRSNHRQWHTATRTAPARRARVPCRAASARSDGAPATIQLRSRHAVGFAEPARETEGNWHRRRSPGAPGRSVPPVPAAVAVPPVPQPIARAGVPGTPAGDGRRGNPRRHRHATRCQIRSVATGLQSRTTSCRTVPRALTSCRRIGICPSACVAQERQGS